MINKEKIKFNDQISEKILKIKDLFPNTVTESETGIKIDFDKLKEELSKDLMDSKEERYQMIWPGKKASIKNSNEPTDKTLTPDRESSVDFDNTQNIYIEGDNLEALKILKKSYEGKVNCIYIDPPYNRKNGKDLIYKDKFSSLPYEYKINSGLINEENEKLTSSKEISGRFHSGWLTMMYPRLKISKDLLSEDGLIFISIDDNEYANLKKITDEIFGEDNLVTSFVWFYEGVNDNQEIVKNTHEYVLMYAKSISKIEINRKLIDINTVLDSEIENSVVKNGPANPKSRITLPVGFPCELEEGTIFKKDVTSIEYNEDIEIKDYKLIKSVTAYSGWSSKNILDLYIKNKFYPVFDSKNQLTTFKIKKSGNIHYSKQRDDSYILSVLRNYGTTQQASDYLSEIGLGDFFDFPKPVGLIRYFINMFKNDSLILDFFSGSATSAHATIDLNAQDLGNRKYIMIQLPESILENSHAFNSGYKNICEIGKERIKRSAKKIKEETGSKIDYGFKVFKVSDSIINHEIEMTPNELLQDSLKFENIREDLSNEDLLYSAILKTGLPLDSKVLKENIGKNEFFTVLDSENNNILVACFDKDVELNENATKFIATQNPLRVYFRDSSFKSDSEKINFEQKLNELTSESVEIYVL